MLFPLGIKSFVEVRQGNYAYVDKTAYVYKMATEGKFYFLNRPRRFGKSMLVSTLKAYFEGRKELFAGLAMDSLEKSWDSCPVLELTLSGEDYTVRGGLESSLEVQIAEWEKVYGSSAAACTPAGRFRSAIINAYEATGKKVVVLIDEYDKPLLDNIDNPEQQRANKDLLRGVYSNIKELDDYIKFALLTGVSKFSQVSIFSGLNNLTDISLDAEYATLCGITECELLANFSESIEELATVEKCTFVEACARLKTNYDGYHFHPDAEGVYNPYSVIRALAQREFGSYWFETGTPTFLTKKIRDANTDLMRFTREVSASEAEMKSSDEKPTLTSLLYQSGYLTIKDRRKTGRYILTLPNREVRNGLLESLGRCYLEARDGQTRFNGGDMYDYLEDGDIEEFMRHLTALFASFDYHLIADAEVHFQSSVYLICTLIGFNSEVEKCTCNGRMDYVVYTRNYIYIFEFKIDGSAEAALAQIDEKGYAAPFATDERKVVCVGVNFSTEKKCVESYAIR